MLITMDKEYIFLKWSPSLKETEKCERSTKDSKKQCIGDNIKNLVLMESDEFNFGINKKEFSNNKMNERQLIKQKNLNPFLQTEYLADIENEELYLRPVNSNLEK